MARYIPRIDPARGCDPNPNCVGSACCQDRVPVSGAQIPLTPAPAPEPIPVTPLNPVVPSLPGERDVPTFVPAMPRQPLDPVATAWTTRCDNGMCPDTTSSVSAGGLPIGFIGENKSAVNAAVPVNSFWARQVFEQDRANRGAPVRSLTQINGDWANQGLSALRSSPEFNQEVANLRPLFGDAAEAVATRRMVEADGMGGTYADSSYYTGDNAARHQQAQIMQSGTMLNRESSRLIEALGIDPAAFNGQGVAYDSNGMPYTVQQQADGEFRYSNSPVGMAIGDYGAMAQATRSITPEYGTYLNTNRVADGKVAQEMGKQAGQTQRAMIRANTQMQVAADRNKARLAEVQARVRQLAAGRGPGGSGPLTFEQQKELIRLRAEQRVLQQESYLRASGRYVEPTATPPRQ